MCRDSGKEAEERGGAELTILQKSEGDRWRESRRCAPLKPHPKSCLASREHAWFHLSEGHQVLFESYLNVSALMDLSAAFAVLFPGYLSWKAVKNEDRDQQQLLLRYWCEFFCNPDRSVMRTRIVFSMFSSVEMVLDTFCGWLPFYREAKMLFFVSLALSALPIEAVYNVMSPLLIHYEVWPLLSARRLSQATSSACHRRATCRNARQRGRVGSGAGPLCLRVGRHSQQPVGHLSSPRPSGHPAGWPERSSS